MTRCAAARIRRVHAIVALLLAFAAASVGCPRKPAAPAQAPQTRPRVVALSPAIAATMRDVALGGLIVGRHGSDKWSDQSLPPCGDQMGIDYEALLRVRPTHVLLQRPEIEARLQQLGAEHHWKIVNYRILSLDDIKATTRSLWTLLGEHAPRPQPSAEPDYIRIDREMTRAWSRRPGIDAVRVGRILLLTSATPPAALGPGSFHQQILEALGATPAIEQGAAYITMDVEDVLRRRPDAIVLFVPREPGDAPRPGGQAEISQLLGPVARSDIPAVQSGHISIIDHPMVQVPSPSAMIEVADELARILEGWSRAGTP